MFYIIELLKCLFLKIIYFVLLTWNLPSAHEETYGYQKKITHHSTQGVDTSSTIAKMLQQH